MKENTANTYNSCLICHEKKTYYDFSIDKFRVEECAVCGLMRLNPQPSDQELAEIYSSNYFIALSDQKGQSHTAALKSGTADHYLDLLEHYAGKPLKGRLLEVGCGQGEFLSRAEARGLSITGLEYSSHAADIAAKKIGSKGKVICGELTHLQGSTELFDYIIFADVLEHVRNPREFLALVHSLLRPNGIAVTIVPSLDSLSARLMKNKWVEFKKEHLWYFSNATLRRLLYTESFGEVQCKPAKKTLSFDYIAQHFDNYPVQPFSSLLMVLKRLLPHFLRRYPIQVVASGIVNFARRQEKSSVQKLSVIMAAYNEEKTLRNVIEKVLAKQISGIEIELIIVESHSTDNTQSIVREYENHARVKVVWQERALGKGNAIRAGLEKVTGDYILIQDADEEYDIEDYDALIQPLVSGEAAFVLGARHGGRMWKMRTFTDQHLTGHFLNFGHWCFTALINILYGLRLKDPFTMYKVFRADCLHGLKFKCNRFDFDCELLIKLVKNGYRPIEIPVNYRSRSFKEGKKVRVFRDPLTWLKTIIMNRFQNA